MKTTNKIVFILTGIFMLGCNSKTDTSITSEGEVGKNNVKNELVANAGNITIRGNSNYEFETELEGAYIITFKEKAIGNLKNVQIYIEIMGGWTEWMPGGINALRSNGWYEGATIQSYSNKGSFKFKVTASGVFEITFEKLPLAKNAAELPVSFTGAGSTFLGPVSVSGDASFKITCSDAQQAGFTVNILDANNGNTILNSDRSILYTNVGADFKLTNNINTTVTKSGLSGTYLIWVCGNGNAKYTVDMHN
jgi:hypothetical protein